MLALKTLTAENTLRMKMRRAAWPAYNEMSFAGVVGSRVNRPQNIPSVSSLFPHDGRDKPSLEAINADTLDITTEHKLAKPFQIENSKKVQQKEHMGQLLREGNFLSSRYNQKHNQSTYNAKSTNLASAGKATKPPENVQFLHQSTYRQQQTEPLITPQYRLWNSTICSPSKYPPPSNVRTRRISPRRTRGSASRSQKRTEFLLNDSTSTTATRGTEKMRREHLSVAADSAGNGHQETENISLFTTHSPPSTIFSVDTQSTADSQLQIVGSHKNCSDNSPWHAPTKEYSLPPQAFVECFHRNRSRWYRRQ